MKTDSVRNVPVPKAGFLLRNEKGILVTTALAAVTGLFLLGYGGWEMIPAGIACIILLSYILPGLIRLPIMAGAIYWFWYSSDLYL